MADLHGGRECALIDLLALPSRKAIRADKALVFDHRPQRVEEVVRAGALGEQFEEIEHLRLGVMDTPSR